MDRPSLKEAESERILSEFKKNPDDHFAVLGIPRELDLLKVYEKYKYYCELFQDEINKGNRDIENTPINIVYKSQEILYMRCNSKTRDSLWHNIASVISLIIFLSGYGFLFYTFLPKMTVLNMTVGLLAGFIFADFLSGIAHIFLDHIISHKNPLFGEVAICFNMHHLDPKEITHENPIQLIKTPFSLGSPVMIATIAIGYFSGSIWFTLLTFWTITFLVLAQVVHRIAHFGTPSNKVIAFLQKVRILLPSKEHMEHHQNGEQTQFCILNGICNPVVNLIAPYIERCFK